jgi:hypothetical protein
LEEKVNNEQYVLSVLQRAFDMGQQGHMDADTMIHWLKQELQSGYTANQSEKAL